MSDKLLITIDFPPNLGGVARYLDTYARKHGLDVLCPQAVFQSSIFETEQIPVFRKKLLWGGWPKWLPLLFWSKIYSRKYKEITISHILPVGYFALLCGKPYILILHGLDILNAGKTKWKKYWAKKVLDKAERIVANSRATGELLRTVFGDLYKYEVEYPLLAPIAKPYKNARQELGLENKKIILSLGRLVKRKGQEKIIKLLPRILREEPSAIFVIAGDGEYKEKLEELVRELKLENKVIFLGKVPEKELPNLYSGCDIFVLPAQPSKDNWEGFGMVCLEAAYFAKPCIVTNVGGLPEAVEDNATGFVVHDDEELGARIIELLKDENLRYALGDEGRARVEEEFLIR
ncbi:glycosyltransferase family 4 protein [Patescibacteria group bacterium]|nr:glycosyltransferase family 4 protein [Patescibacteria group bacterium]